MVAGTRLLLAKKDEIWEFKIPGVTMMKNVDPIMVSNLLGINTGRPVSLYLPIYGTRRYARVDIVERTVTGVSEGSMERLMKDRGKPIDHFLTIL